MLEVFKAELSAIEKLEKLSQKLAATESYTPEYAALSAQIENLNAYISSHDCYLAEVKIKTVLNGMGFQNNTDRLSTLCRAGRKPA